MRIERIKDPQVVNQVLRTPELYALGTDDLSPPAENLDMTPAIDTGMVYFLAPMVDDEMLGLVMFKPLTSTTFEAHINILPEFWGAGHTVTAAATAVKWMFEHTECLKVAALIAAAEYTMPALKVAQRIGMTVDGVMTKSIIKNGEMYDQILLGITEEELICTEQ